jgi:hypothetical protein
MKKTKKQKKAQIETMGLLVVVVLVSLILFFVLAFNLKKDPGEQSEKEVFEETQAISNIGTTMLETTSSCEWTVRELLEDCAYRKEIVCKGNLSCVEANNTMTKILDLTLNEWDYAYNIVVKNSQNYDVLSQGTACKNVTNSRRETTPFGTNYGSMSLIITTCNR